MVSINSSVAGKLFVTLFEYLHHAIPIPSSNAMIIDQKQPEATFDFVVDALGFVLL
jgi:hypothetical protein